MVPTHATYHSECANQVTCNSRVNWRVHVYIFLGLNITSFRYERHGEGSRAKRRRKERRQWVSVCRKPRIVPSLPPRAAEQSGFVSWKRASYTITTTWPQFQLFRRYRQIEEATSAKRTITIGQRRSRALNATGILGVVSVGPPLMIITPFAKDSINPDNRSPIFTERPPDIRPFIVLLLLLSLNISVDLSNNSYPISSFRLTNTNDGYCNA